MRKIMQHLPRYIHINYKNTDKCHKIQFRILHFLYFKIFFQRMWSRNGIRVYFEHNWHKRGVLRLWRYWIRNKMYSKREKVWWHQWLFWWVGWRYQYLWWVLDLIAHYHQKYFIGCIFLLINVVWMNGLIRRLIRLSFWPVSLWRW